MEGNDANSGAIPIAAVAAAQAVYRLTGLPGFDAALRFSLRKRATDVIAGCAALAHSAGLGTSHGRDALLGDLAALRELLAFGRSLGAITAEHALRVSKAYERVGEWAAAAGGGVLPAAIEPSVADPYPAKKSADALNERQQRIIEFLAARGQAQIGDLQVLIGAACSEKTLQRDLWQLVEAGFIRRQGDNRWTTYIYRTSYVR